EVFDPRDETFAAERDRLRALLTRDEYTRAEASVLNAHYTDPAVVAVVWDALIRAGFPVAGSWNPVAAAAHSSATPPTRRSWSEWKATQSRPASPPHCTPRRRSATKASRPPASRRTVSPPRWATCRSAATYYTTR